jgi:hypothetical protein
MSAPALPVPLSPTSDLPQAPVFVAALRLLGADVRALGGLGARAHAVARRLPCLGATATIDRADLGLSAAGLDRLHDMLGVRHLVIHARTKEDGAALRQAGFRRVGAPRRIVEVALGPAAQMAEGLSPGWRDRIARARAAGLVARRAPLPAAPSHWIFGRASPVTCAPAGVALTPRLISAMSALEPGAAQIISVTRAGRPVAAMLFVRHGKGATRIAGWLSPRWRRHGAEHLCLWQAMLELRELGAETIELGSAGPHRCQSDVLAGAGGTMRLLGGTWLGEGTKAKARDAAVASRAVWQDAPHAAAATV